VHHLYVAEKDDELSLDVGDVINVQDMSDPGWWVGEQVKNGKAGWFPSNVRTETKRRKARALASFSFPSSLAHWLPFVPARHCRNNEGKGGSQRKEEVWTADYVQ